MRIFLSEQKARFWEPDFGGFHRRAPTRSTGILMVEEFYFVVEGVGRIRIGDKTLTVPKYGGVLVGPEQLRQVFNDTETEVLWLIIGAPEKELEASETLDQKLLYPVDPKQLPKELDGVAWPPKD